VSGTVAAAVCTLVQPLDKMIFASEYDEVELLGRFVVRGERWYPAGLALQLSRGALLGAGYANLAPTLPVPFVMRGPAVALVEHIATWPLNVATDRLHPARKQLPKLAGNDRAFLQGALRWLLFGLVLGELERRLNAVPEPAPPLREADISSNGHGSIEHAISAGSP
jgi:hypothetical protein